MCNSNCNCNNNSACNPCDNVYYDYAGFKCITNPCVILSSQPNSSKAKYIRKYGLGSHCFDKYGNLVNDNECDCSSTTEPTTSCGCGCGCETTQAPSTTCPCECETPSEPL